MDPTGIGMIMECVAAAMGWQSVTAAQQRVLLTLRSLAGHTPGFSVRRNPRGFYTQFFDPDTGASDYPQAGMMCVVLAYAYVRAA
jgi:hypothetical protein